MFAPKIAVFWSYDLTYSHISPQGSLSENLVRLASVRTRRAEDHHESDSTPKTKKREDHSTNSFPKKCFDTQLNITTGVVSQSSLRFYTLLIVEKNYDGPRTHERDDAVVAHS